MENKNAQESESADLDKVKKEKHRKGDADQTPIEDE